MGAGRVEGSVEGTGEEKARGKDEEGRTESTAVEQRPGRTGHRRGSVCAGFYACRMSIFAKIMRGEIPCFKVYEDEHAFAFLDINPISRGHTLVIPREPAERLDGLSDAAAAGLGVALARVARAVVQATGCPSYNILQNNGHAAGQLVMHAHFHIIPRYDDASGPAASEGGGGGRGLDYVWPALPIDKAAAPDLARRIAECAASAS